MAKTNGNLKWIIAAITIATILAGAVASHEIIGSKVTAMEPKVDRATQHIDKDEIETAHIKEDIIELKKDFKEFTVEQRAVNTQILHKLNESP